MSAAPKRSPREKKKPKLDPVFVDPDLKELVSEYAKLEGRSVASVVAEMAEIYGLGRKYQKSLEDRLARIKKAKP